MKKNKSSLSKATSYEEIGEFWDKHDLSDFWEKTKDADFDIQIISEKTLYLIEEQLSVQVQEVAHKQKVSPGRLINKWVREKLQEEGQTVSKRH